MEYQKTINEYLQKIEELTEEAYNNGVIVEELQENILLEIINALSWS